jgi:hypothetical protein
MARERTSAAALIRSADPSRYGTLITALANQYATGKDEYPKDITSAKSLFVMYKTPTNAPAPRTANQCQQHSSTAAETSALTLAHCTAIAVAGTDGLLHPSLTCFNCNLPGHMQGECPKGLNAATTGTTLTQYANILAQLAQESEHGIDPVWILLDSKSTISVFKNEPMLTNIRHSGRIIRAITNGGHQDSDTVGDFPNLGEVWFNRNSIANILSLADVQKVCCVTMDTSSEPALLVHRLNGSVMKFAEHASGLYLYKCHNPTNNSISWYDTMVSTVAEHKKVFSRREIQAADVARELYRKIGRPDEAEFQSILCNNLTFICPKLLMTLNVLLLFIPRTLLCSKGRPRGPLLLTARQLSWPSPPQNQFSNIIKTSPSARISFFVQGIPFSTRFPKASVSASRRPVVLIVTMS